MTGGRRWHYCTVEVIIYCSNNSNQNKIKDGMKLKTLRSCEEIRQQGLDGDGDYPIDPDGELIGKL